jgi:hypothetical protein
MNLVIPAIGGTAQAGQGHGHVAGLGLGEGHGTDEVELDIYLAVAVGGVDRCYVIGDGGLGLCDAALAGDDFWRIGDENVLDDGAAIGLGCAGGGTSAIARLAQGTGRRRGLAGVELEQPIEPFAGALDHPVAFAIIEKPTQEPVGLGN